MASRISLETRREVLAAVEKREGTHAQIAARFGVSTASLRRWLQLHQAEQGKESGRCRLTDEDLETLRQLVREGRQQSQEALIEALAERTGKKVSVTTLNNALRKARIRSVRPTVATEAPAAEADAEAGKATRYGPQHRRERVGAHYPTSTTDAEWELLRPIFAPERTGAGRPAEHDRRIMLDAIFFVVRGGIAWRLLPNDFPPWGSVYTTFQRWSRQGRFEKMSHELRAMWRRREGREEQPSSGIVDSQSVKTTEKGGLAVSMATRRSTEESGTSSSMSSV